MSIVSSPDRPVIPAVVGTYHVGGELDFTYTVGPPDVLVPALHDLLRPQVPLAVDIETFGLGADARRIKCVTVGHERSAAILDPRDQDQHTLVQHFLQRAARDQLPLVFHRSAFDVPNLSLYGLLDTGGTRDSIIARVHDTLLYARLAWPDKLARKDLESLALRLLGLRTEESIKDAFKRLGLTIKEGYRRMDLDSSMYLIGAASDAVITARLFPRVRRAAWDRTTTGHPFGQMGVTGDEALRLVEREQVTNRMSLRRSCKGIVVDLDYLNGYVDKTRHDLTSTESDLVAAGVRPGNAGDLVSALESRGLLPQSHPRTAKTGRPSTKADDLQAISHPLAQAYVLHKQITKVIDDYLAKAVNLALPGPDGLLRIHPVVNYLIAQTGRMSYEGWPVQQIPEPARGVLCADPWDELTSLDWAQIEPCCAANCAWSAVGRRDESLLHGYETGTLDFYAGVGAQGRIPRKIAKIVVLAQMYGEGIAKLARDLGIDPEEAVKLRQTVFRAMPATTDFLFKLKDIAAQYQAVMTLSGRILSVPMGRGFDGRPPSIATHKGVNYFVQGSAYDLLAEAAVRIEEAGLGDAVYLLMHDEIVCSTLAAHDIRRIMEKPPERLCTMAGRVPILRTDRADLGVRWAKT